MIAPPPASGFRLTRYFTVASLAAFLLVAAPLMYLERMGDDFFEQVLREQSRYFKQVQDGFTKQHDTVTRSYLLSVHEAGSFNLTRLFANALWERDFAPFVAKVQRIPVDQCRAIADVTGAGGKSVQPAEKKACYTRIGKQIMALPEFRALDAKVFDTMKNSTVFKVKVFDLRGMTVYSSEHSQIGEDRTGDVGWESAVAGKPASELTHRDKFSAFEGVIENRDLISSYLPVLAPGGEKIVGVFETYSDVTAFLEQINAASAQIGKQSAENQAQVERAVAANEAKADENANLLLAVVLGLLVLLYCALLLIVRHGQRIIDKEKVELERAEEALSAGESRYRTIIQTSMDGFWIVDAEGRFLEVNDAYCRLIGYEREELLKMGIPDVEAVESPQDTARHVREVMAKGYDHFVTRHRRKDGQLLDIEASVNFMSDRNGARIFVFMRDVTERTQAELALARQKDLYDMLSQTNQAIVRMTSREELFPAVCRVAVEHGRFRFAWIGLIGKEDRRVKPVARYGEDAGYVDQAYISADESDAAGRGPTGQALRAGEHAVSNDFLNDPATAPWHEAARHAGVRASAALPICQGGAVVGAINLYAGEPGFFTEDVLATLGEMAIDVSYALDNFAHEVARKQAEETLRAAEEQFRGLVEQAITGIYIVQDGKFAYVNPRLAEILGYDSAEELASRDPLSVVAEKDRGTVAENIRRRVEGEVPSIAYGFAALCKDGSIVEVGVHGTRATYRGRPAIIGLMQDISEKKRAEEQIQRYVAQLENTFMRTVEIATTLSEMRDPYTAGHERRVGEIAAAIGAELGFDARRVEGLRVAGYLHDVGKITIPAEILAKPGKISPTEFLLIKGHAQASYDILKNVEFPWPVAEVALQHHERMDGSGYPQGLKGEAILLEARIMAVADVVEAMSSHRPYRAGLGIEAALTEVERGCGTSYDAVVADACVKLFREKGYAVPA